MERKMFETELKELYLMQQSYAILFSVANKIQSYCDDKLLDISSRQLMTMIAILHLPPDDTNLKNIALLLGTSKQNANKLLNSLKKNNYITISPGKNDKRAINVQITGEGNRIMNQGAETSIYSLATIFKSFSVDELERLCFFLKKISHFDNQPYQGFETDMTRKKELSADDIGILSRFKAIRQESK